MKPSNRRLILAAFGLALAVGTSTTHADLKLVGTGATFQGKGGYSADGLGQLTAGATIQAEVPAGSTVVQAYLYGAVIGKAQGPTITIVLDSTTVTLNNLNSEQATLSSYRGDVTAQVAAKVAAGGGGITNFAVNSDFANLDGVALVVIFSNPALPVVSIAVLEGGLSSSASVTTVSYSTPVDKSLPGFSATLALGISYGFQGFGAPSHICGSGSPQFSLVDINGQRLTSCAGNFDDAVESGDNGNLITVGGVGDSTNNPSLPFQEAGSVATPRVEDDELYDIAPFISNGDTQTVINTQNPSGDDQIFLAILQITAQAVFTPGGEVCDPDGSPNGIDEDEDGIKDEGCFQTRLLNFTPASPSLIANFPALGNVRANSLTLTHMFGVFQPFDVIVKASIEDPAAMAFSPPQFGAATTCSSNKLNVGDTSTEPCVRYEINTDAVAGIDYGAGDRAVQWRIEFFQPDLQKVNSDPVMGYSAGCGTFNESILDHAIFPDNEDPIEYGYTDDYGSCAIAGVTPKPAVPPADDQCHVDGSPNGIDEDGDGITDEGCSVARSFNFSPGVTAHTFVFNDLGNVKPNELGLDHTLGVTGGFELTVVATIVDPADVSFGGDFGAGTVCASNNIFTADPLDPLDPLAGLPCVHYEVFGADGAPYTMGTDAIEWKIKYFAPALQSATQKAGMGYSPDCNGIFNRDILFSFVRFDGDDADPIEYGYTDDYGSCVIAAASPPPAPELNLPDDMTVLAASAAGTPVTFTATVTSVVDGVLTAIPATCNPPSGSTFPIGSTPVNCTGGDAFPTLSGSFTINVVYGYGICTQYDTVKPKKAGSTIPIKLQLCDASGNNLSSPGIVLHAISLTPSGGIPTGEVEDPGNSQPDDNFRFTSPSYHFNLKTTGLGSGLWTLSFTVGADPTIYTITFVIK